jgi:zinc finger protein
VSSFECLHCGHTNREVQSGLSLAESGGCRYILKVNEAKDLDRQIIKGCHASLLLPEIDLEIPSCTQKGVCTTLEGILQETVNGLQKALDNYKESSQRECINKVLQKVISFSSREFVRFMKTK